MSWIEVKVTETIRPASGAAELEYVARVEVVRSRGIEAELFVYAVNDETFSHAASPYDLNVFPRDAGSARADGKDFYRQAWVELRYAAKSQAQEAVEAIKARLAVTNRAWQEDQDGPFGGVSTTIYDSGDA